MRTNHLGGGSSWGVRVGCFAVAGWLVGALGCGQTPNVASTNAAEEPLRRDKLRHASFLLRGRDVGAQEWNRWRGVPEPSILESMADDPFLATAIAPAVLLKNNLLTPVDELPSAFQLSSFSVAGGTAHTLQEPCAAKDLVSVAPWWDLDHPIQVCATSFRPTIWTTTGADDAPPCGGAETVPGSDRPSVCGCGPNLIRCTLPEHADILVASAQREIVDTIAYAVAKDRPLDEVFTANATVRDRWMELVLLRGIAEERRLADPEPLLRQAERFGDKSLFAPRLEVEPGQHAGIVSAAQLAHSNADSRQRMRIIYEVLWCAGESAPGATPEALFALHTPTLSVLGTEDGEGWQELAARPVCTDCHARLDYGMQFFKGWQTKSTGSGRFVAGLSAGTGPLYGTGIGDPRGTARLTPAAFAALATSQPEFLQCMARNAAEQVFGPSITSAHLDRIVASLPSKRPTFRQLTLASLREFFACRTCEPPGLGGQVAEAGSHRALPDLVEEYCIDCHFEGGTTTSLEGDLDARTAALAIDQVLWGRMPKDGALSEEVRREFLAAGVAAGQIDADAAEFLRARSAPPAALPLIVARQLASPAAPVDAKDLNSVENALNGRDNLFTPNFATLTGLEALETCKDHRDRRSCLDEQLSRTWGLEP